MNLSIPKEELIKYSNHLADNILRDGLISLDSNSTFITALDRLENTFNHIYLPYFRDANREAYFNHRHSDHMAMWLYLLSNQCYKDNYIESAEKFFYLNKIMHALDAYYKIELPDIFLFVHPVGSVLGNANYKNYFIVYQNVTIGSDPGGVYPSFGEGCVIYSGSSIINRCLIGNNCTIAANSYIRNTDLKESSTVFGQHPNNHITMNKQINSSLFGPQ
jgi:serine O-acetyltransferase